METKCTSRLVPNELIAGLRLSKRLPNTYSGRSNSEINIVHGEDFICLGYLVRASFGDFLSGLDIRQYSIYTADFGEAARLAGLDESALKQACQMPDPTVRTHP